MRNSSWHTPLTHASKHRYPLFRLPLSQLITILVCTSSRIGTKGSQGSKSECLVQAPSTLTATHLSTTCRSLLQQSVQCLPPVLTAVYGGRCAL